MSEALYTAEDVERIAREVAEHAARSVMARMAAPVSLPPPATPPPALPAWCSTAEYAAHIGKAPKTIREYARRAPAALALKYGRDWRVAGPAFDAWVRRGGPFRAANDDQPEKGIDHEPHRASK